MRSAGAAKCAGLHPRKGIENEEEEDDVDPNEEDELVADDDADDVVEV